MSDANILEDPNSRAILRLELAEVLPSLHFSLIINLIDQIYSKHPWIRLTDEAMPGEGPTDKFEPDSILFNVRRLEARNISNSSVWLSISGQLLLLQQAH